MPHFGGGGIPHFGGIHIAPRGFAHFAPHIGGAHFAAPRFGHFAAHGAHVHVGRFAAHGVHGHAASSGVHENAVHAAAVHGAHGPVHPTNPGNFAAHRHFAGSGAFGPFYHYGWHWHHHLGWIGPLFWPYAYGDFFYYALWPDYYYDYDPFWVYGYGDVYEAVFSPYVYDEYVQGPRAQRRMTALTHSVAQSCDDETNEVTGWPIDQIHDAVQPNEQQNALLDALGNAVVQASDIIRQNCPTAVSFTPTGRLDAMQERLTGLTQAVDLVTPPLTQFYDSLSDEQKARFNAIGPTGGRPSAPSAHAAANPQADCSAAAMAWPSEQIERVVHPTDAQRSKLDALQQALAGAADTIKAACPSEIPNTPPGRMAAAGKRLHALLSAVEAVRPVLADFYNSLSDDQKARFNTMGRQLFANTAQE